MPKVIELSSHEALMGVLAVVGTASLPLLLLPKLSMHALRWYCGNMSALRVGGVLAASVGLLLLTAEPTDRVLANATAAGLGAVAVLKGVVALSWPSAYGRLVRGVSSSARSVFLWGLVVACLVALGAVALAGE